MQNTIGIQQEEAQRLFENDESRAQRLWQNEQDAQKNKVANLKTQAEVTGVVPLEWSLANNPYMNSDGTIKDQYKDVDFSAVMANARRPAPDDCS